MNVTVDQLLARIGAKDIEVMLLEAEVSRLRAELAMKNDLLGQQYAELRRTRDAELRRTRDADPDVAETNGAAH